MKRIGLFFCSAVFLTLYILCCSDHFIEVYIKKWPNSERPSFLRLDKSAYGDLYGLSHIAGYKSEVDLNYNLKDWPVDSIGAVQLYVIGDSFLKRTFNTDSGSFHWGNVEIADYKWFGVSTDTVQLNRQNNVRKILLIEMAERFIPGNISKPGLQQYLNFYGAADQQEQGSSTDWSKFTFVPKAVEQNIATLLFGYEMFGPIKSGKAFVDNDILASRGSQVYESRTQHRLFLSSTVDIHREECSFKPVPDITVLNYVRLINTLREKFLKLGFDEVVFSIIPNSASVTPPPGMTYNKLIPKIQHHDSLRAPMIDVYAAMSSASDKEDLYWRSDSHWTAKGFTLWLNGLKERLKSLHGNSQQNLM